MYTIQDLKKTIFILLGLVFISFLKRVLSAAPCIMQKTWQQQEMEITDS
jgi:hypothetical protein